MRWMMLITALAIATQAHAEIVDLGDGGSYTGYESEAMENGLQRVHAYDWVCPYGASRPADGVVRVYDEFGELLREIRLERLQCEVYFPWRDPMNPRIVSMEKRYRPFHHIAGGKAGDLEGAMSDRGGSGSAAAASAAGAAAAGVFSGCTGNPFALCSGGRPGRKNPLRWCFDVICPFGG